MEGAEEELKHPVVEDAAEETVAGRHRPEAVAVAEAESAAADFGHIRLDEALHAQLLEIAVCPHVMVSLKEEDLHSPVHKVLQGRKNPYITFRYDIAVLIPEVPYVTHEIQGVRILRKSLQERHETTFTAGRIADLQAKMDI